MATPPLSDAQLIARCIVGDDRHAFAELVKRHQSSIRACLRKLTSGNAALSDDLAQETFIQAWRNLKSFRQDARFSTWLYRIATNCWLMHARKRHEELLGDRDAELVVEDAESMSHGLESAANHAGSSAMKLDLERAMNVLTAQGQEPGQKGIQITEKALKRIRVASTWAFLPRRLRTRLVCAISIVSPPWRRSAFPG